MTSRCAAHDARIRQLVGEGNTAQATAAAIGHGISRNSIIGYCSRKGIKMVRKPGGQVTRKQMSERPSAQPEPVRSRGRPTNPQPWHWMMPAWAAIGPAPKTCRYIHGEPAGAATRYCGKPVREGSSYCAECHARTHQQSTRRNIVQVDIGGEG